jgi:5,10-methylene-tetrahydrofolate dehydrogenase/methenyl tetrahydrofolate cyclohydrolase
MSAKMTGQPLMPSKGTPAGSMVLIRHALAKSDFPLNAVVIAGPTSSVPRRSLLAANATVTIAHRAPDLPALARTADIL